MNDILTSKPTPSPDHTHLNLSSSPLHSNAPTTTGLPPRGNDGGRGKISGVRGHQQRRRIASGVQRSVSFSDSGTMKRSQSDSRLYDEYESQSDANRGELISVFYNTTDCEFWFVFSKRPNEFWTFETMQDQLL